ncbi:MAG: glycosyltransferase family 9 protein [Chitinophagales bacterium]|nr:glycosyltransferase family 9 protein [Chitinophagales bacterium]
MKILIIRFSSIGDIVLTTPVVRCLKKQLPSSEIHYLTKPSYNSIIKNNPYINKTHYLNERLSDTITELRNEKYDLIIDLHNNFRTWLIKMQLGVKSIAFNKLNFEKWIYVTFKWNVLPDIHIVDRYLETVRYLGVKNDGEGLDYFLSAQDVVSLESLPLTHLHGFIAVVIGAKHITKRLPLDKLKNLCRLLAYPVVLLGGPEDKDQGDIIAGEEPLKIFNGCGKFTLNQSAFLIKTSLSVITHDTGLMHIAAAFRKKIISIWGNTVPEFGMYPYVRGVNRPLSKMVEIEKLYCRPCSKIGYKRCPEGHFKCMNLIDERRIPELLKTLQ